MVLMNILIQNPYVARGGAESRLRVLLRALVQRPEIDEIHLMCVAGETLPPRLDHPKLHLWPTSPARIGSHTAALVRNRGIDVIQLHNEIGLGTDGLAAAQDLGVPSIWVVHDYWPLCGWRFLIDLRMADEAPPCDLVDPDRCADCVGPEQVQATADARRVIDRCDAGVVPSARVATILSSNSLLGERLRTIHPWIDLDTFAPEPGTPREPHQVAFVSNLFPHKGFGVLARAWQRINQTLPSARLVVVADDRNRDRARSLVEDLQLTHVTFRPPLPPADLVRVYSASSLTVFPSLWDEVVGLAWVESLACGTPVVAAETGSIPELLRTGGDLFRRGDHHALAEAIERILTSRSRWKAQAADGQRDVRRRFAAPRAAEAFVALYRELSLTAKTTPP